MHGTSLAARGAEPAQEHLSSPAGPVGSSVGKPWLPSCICYTWQQGPLPSCLCVKPEHLGGELKLGNSINRSSVLFSNDSLIWLSARYCAALPKWTVNLLIAGTTSLHPLSAVIDVTAPSHKLIVCCFVCSEQIACRCIINS